ncbi:DNA-binding protein [Hydrogenophaga sp.]|uniref:DNA-binding protein n=1 Tax=Hydrogenophaga sp. TaxID=1904254 RepID=UPI002727A7BB|nr:DNA-binding protein [Hydrogenophaga sp.]MDO8905955.1 DNA-binding protein [Hydrogenophaga sp.]
MKDELLRRYRTDRFQTVYGLTGKGVVWLAEHDVDATASVRRVSDMTNPEHRLWAQFLALCCEARGLTAYTEQELLLVLAKTESSGQAAPQGLLTVKAQSSRGQRTLELRPDAVAIESDGLTWFEVDRSARGAQRASSLKSLVLAIGRNTRLGERLRRVIVLTRTPRIEHRVLAALNALASESSGYALCEGRRVLLSCGPGAFSVICTVEQMLGDGRTQLVDVPVGHVIVQALPMWLPKFRLDGRDGHSCSGWLPENYLPYRRLPSMSPWHQPASPLLRSD